MGADRGRRQSGRDTNGSLQTGAANNPERVFTIVCAFAGALTMAVVFGEVGGWVQVGRVGGRVGRQAGRQAVGWVSRIRASPPTHLHLPPPAVSAGVLLLEYGFTYLPIELPTDLPTYLPRSLQVSDLISNYKREAHRHQQKMEHVFSTMKQVALGR